MRERPQEILASIHTLQLEGEPALLQLRADEPGIQLAVLQQQDGQRPLRRGRLELMRRALHASTSRWVEKETPEVAD